MFLNLRFVLGLEPGLSWQHNRGGHLLQSLAQDNLSPEGDLLTNRSNTFLRTGGPEQESVQGQQGVTKCGEHV